MLRRPFQMKHTHNDRIILLLFIRHFPFLWSHIHLLYSRYPVFIYAPKNESIKHQFPTGVYSSRTEDIYVASEWQRFYLLTLKFTSDFLFALSLSFFVSMDSDDEQEKSQREAFAQMDLNGDTFRGIGHVRSSGSCCSCSPEHPQHRCAHRAS